MTEMEALRGRYNTFLMRVKHITFSSIPRMSKKMASQSKYNAGYRDACETVRRRMRKILINESWKESK